MSNEEVQQVVSLVVTIAVGAIVSVGVGKLLGAMVPRLSHPGAEGAVDISNKTIGEMLTSDMTIEELVRSVWKLEDEMRR